MLPGRGATRRRRSLPATPPRGRIGIIPIRHNSHPHNSHPMTIMPVIGLVSNLGMTICSGIQRVDVNLAQSARCCCLRCCLAARTPCLNSPILLIQPVFSLQYCAFLCCTWSHTSGTLRIKHSDGRVLPAGRAEWIGQFALQNGNKLAARSFGR